MGTKSKAVIASVNLNEKMTREDMEWEAYKVASEVYGYFKDFAEDVLVEGPRFQALLHTPCSQYAG